VGGAALAIGAIAGAIWAGDQFKVRLARSAAEARGAAERLADARKAAARKREGERARAASEEERMERARAFERDESEKTRLLDGAAWAMTSRVGDVVHGAYSFVPADVPCRYTSRDRRPGLQGPRPGEPGFEERWDLWFECRPSGRTFVVRCRADLRYDGTRWQLAPGSPGTCAAGP
jgi:hypothetical protein